MVRAISNFIEFCYLVWWSILDDNDLVKLNEYLAKFHEAQEIFKDEEIWDDFCLPQQHALVHYHDMIIKFGAPNGLCSSITESRHIKAVKEPYRRSSQFNTLVQILNTNQCLDKLGASTWTSKQGKCLTVPYGQAMLTQGHQNYVQSQMKMRMEMILMIAKSWVKLN